MSPCGDKVIYLVPSGSHHNSTLPCYNVRLLCSRYRHNYMLDEVVNYKAIDYAYSITTTAPLFCFPTLVDL